MNRNERVVLLAWFVVVLLVLVTQVSVVFGVLGAVAGAAVGLPVAKTRALRGRRAGSDLAVPGGVRLQKVGTTIGAHLGSVLFFVLVAAVVPGLRDRFVALTAGAVTAFCLTVTADRLRRQG